MGEVAGRYSDLCILTSDHSAQEDPVAIMEEVEKGLRTLNLKKWRPDEINDCGQPRDILHPDRERLFDGRYDCSALGYGSDRRKAMRIIRSR